MPGRQSHGRSLLGNQKPTGGKGKQQKSKSKARAHALDAFAIAAKQIEPEKITRRGRNLELDPEVESRGGKHRRDEADDDDDGSEGDEDEAPRKKRTKQSAFDEDDGEDDGRSNMEGGSDSEGNEWHVGVNGDDDDSELNSDEAFGESDDEKFEGYTFRGSRSQKKQDNSDDEGDDGESLGSDAIDLADALDQSSDDEEGSAGDSESGSEDDGSESDSVDEEDEDDEVDVSRLGDLQKLIKGFADTEEDAETNDGPSSKQTISLEDLGLSGVKDPLIKKSVKLMKKEQKAEATKRGSTKKLDVPLPRRQQDQLLRAAAYEKTNETLDRWNETVKHNRRADHLMFPLAHTLPDAGLDNGELLPLTKKTAGTELEQTIMSIMEESGLGPSAKSKDQPQKQIDSDGREQTISRAELKDLWAQRRRDRELESREQARSKRIKKIKSKTYRRIHRKERLGDEANHLEEMRANGDIDSEEEREAAHRRRALERVGAKHKESKWAKMGSRVGRAVWDDDYRAGLTDMARRNEELRKRVEGKTATGRDGEDDSDASSISGDDDEGDNARLLKQLDAVDAAEVDDGQPHAGLMKMAFMQRAEARRKQANDELEAELRRDLGSGSEDDREQEDDTEVQVGRRTFGTGKDKKATKVVKEPSRPSEGAISNGTKAQFPSATAKPNTSIVATETLSAADTAGAWQVTASKRKKGKKSVNGPAVAELDLESAVQVPVKSAPKSRKAKATNSLVSGTNRPVTTVQVDGDDSSDDDVHLPLAVRDLELAERAFGGEDVVAEFEAEKEAIVSEDEEKMVDNTMPGWGSWAGEGVGKRGLKRGKVMTKKPGIKKNDRKDAKLEKVIVNEKRVKKVRCALSLHLVF